MLVRVIILGLIRLADLALSWLPLHTPIAWPDLGWLGNVFLLVGLVTQFFHWQVVVTVLGLIVITESYILTYAAYRQLLGFIPAMK